MTSVIFDPIIKRTNEYTEATPKQSRKSKGQFFTPAETARYMASLFQIPKKPTIRLLDPGAGSGILTAALVERLQNIRGLQKITVVCYETDEKVLPLLEQNLRHVKEASRKPFEYVIREENYIVSQADAFTKYSPEETYDLIIGNPPYKKLPAKAPETQAMRQICYGAPNLYALFTAMSLFELGEDGEMVFIIPRSWASGAYFQKFREYLFQNSRIEQIHLFHCRDKVFQEQQVLQETMILKLVKKPAMNRNVTITASDSNQGFDKKTRILVPAANIIRGADRHMLLPTSQKDVEGIEMVNRWKETLPTIGMKMKTGLTIGFRNRELLSDQPSKDTVPLYYCRHIQNGIVCFPDQRGVEYLIAQKKGLLQKNQNYLFLKRFTTKEEAKRLQCGIYLSSIHPELEWISTDNKLNFIDRMEGALTKEQVFGLYVLFNSSLYDLYYRILDGSTQVNATEMNQIPVPPLNVIESLGRSLLARGDLSVEACDELMEDL